ncbi:uncharacterized protein DEA37_0007127 [Paragonimus westermani]|uniref:Uncharacterized protein n=1 Tax=Paragonimus westermani TaxID=34504 RepID=A0A5J4P124_9TREM|nr:uncharacterized protein DEA37_0007127 [Paragonimus westermani]
MTEKSVVHSAVTHDSVHRLHSYTDHAHSSSSIHKQSSKKHKTPLEGLTEESTQPESELSALDRFVEGQRIEVLASSTDTRNAKHDANVPTVILNPRPAQKDWSSGRQPPVDTKTKPEADRPLPYRSSATSHRRDSKSYLDASSAKSRSSRPLEGGNEDIASVESFGSDEMGTSAGPAAAAAIATSLYGSGAPYLHAREKARQELAKLVGIYPTEVELSTARKDDTTGLHDLVSVAQSPDTVEGASWHPSHCEDRDGQAILSQTHKPHQTERPVEERLKFSHRTSKINYV